MAHYWAWKFLACGGTLLPLGWGGAVAQAVPLPAGGQGDTAIAGLPATAEAPVHSPIPVEVVLEIPASPGTIPTDNDAPAAEGSPALALPPEFSAPEVLPLEVLTPEFPAPDSSTPEFLAPHATDSVLPIAGVPEAGRGGEAAAAVLLPLVPATGELPIDTEANAAPLAQVRPAPAGDGWEYVIQPYLFLPFNINATVNVAGVEQSASVGLGDLFNLDRVLAAALRFEARNPQYGFFGDIAYVYAREGRGLTNFPLPPAITDPLSALAGVPIPPGTPASVRATATTRTTTLDLGGFYRVVDQTLGDGGPYPRLLVDPLAGLRLVFLSGSVDITDIAVAGVPLGGRSLSQSATLVQPLIGVQASLELSERWAVGLRGDLAGFGIGADENLSWNLLLGTRYSFSDTLALQLAYRFTELRYRESSFGLSQSQNGLWVGLDIGL